MRIMMLRFSQILPGFLLCAASLGILGSGAFLFKSRTVNVVQGDGSRQEYQYDFSNRMHGWNRGWHPNGMPAYCVRYSHGIPIEGDLWYPNGALQAQIWEDHYELRYVHYLENETTPVNDVALADAPPADPAQALPDVPGEPLASY
jgi:hypothetical protein